MRGNKKIIALATIFALSLGTVSNVSAVSYGTENNNAAAVEYKQVFSDVPKSHWAYSYIGEMHNRGVVNGFPDGNFYPSATVTRAEFAKMMTTAANIDVSSQKASASFTDVTSSHWAVKYVEAAKPYLSSYRNPDSTSSFRPDTAAVREDIAVAMVKLKGIDANGADESILKTMFSDYSSISADARKYIAAAIENGIVSGYEDGTFKAQASITRAEAVAMMWRAFQYGSESKYWEDDTKNDANVTMNQPIPPTFANNSDDKKDKDDFNQPAAPTISMGTDKKDDEDDFNQPTVPAVSMGIATPIPTEKPKENSEVYYVDTLDATFSGSMAAFTTFDENSNTVYWYNRSENVIKAMNGDSRKISNYLNINEMKILDDGAVTFGDTDKAYHAGISVRQIFYDAYEDEMVIELKADVSVDPNLLEDVMDAEEYLFTFDGNEFTQLGSKFDCLFEYIIVGSTKDYYVCHDGVVFLVNKKTGKDVSYPDNRFQNAFVYNGDIYAITSSGKMSYDVSKLYKLETSSGETKWKEIQDVGMSMGSAAKDSKFYIFDLHRDAIVSCNTNGKLTKEMDLTNLKTLDMLPVKFGSDYASESGSIIVTNNMSVIYFDGRSNKVMRIIYKD